MSDILIRKVLQLVSHYIGQFKTSFRGPRIALSVIMLASNALKNEKNTYRDPLNKVRPNGILVY